MQRVRDPNFDSRGITDSRASASGISSVFPVSTIDYNRREVDHKLRFTETTLGDHHALGAVALLAYPGSGAFLVGATCDVLTDGI